MHRCYKAENDLFSDIAKYTCQIAEKQKAGLNVSDDLEKLQQLLDMRAKELNPNKCRPTKELGIIRFRK